MTIDFVGKAKEFLRGRQFSYRMTFQTPHGEKVLRDLAKFCRANVTVFNPNQRATDVMIGRNEVWLRIQEHLRLNDEEMWSKYGSSQPKQGE